MFIKTRTKTHAKKKYGEANCPRYQREPVGFEQAYESSESDCACL